MSNNERALYVFVKGNLGRGAYIITDSKGNQLQAKVLEDLNDESGKMLGPYRTDRDTLINSLEFIRDNRNKNGIPEKPIIFAYSTFENNYHMSSDLKDRVKAESKDFFDKILQLKQQLDRRLPNKDESIKFYYIPEGFNNKMDDVNQLLGKPCRKPKK